MTKMTLEGNWNQLVGQIKQQWGKLTNDKLTEINGNYEKLVGSLQLEYGLTEEEAKKAVNEFLDKSEEMLSKTE